MANPANSLNPPFPIPTTALTIGVEIEAVRLREDKIPHILNVLKKTGATLQADPLIFTDSGHGIPPFGGPEIATKPYPVKLALGEEGAVNIVDWGCFKSEFTSLFSLAAHFNRFCDIHVHFGLGSKTESLLWSPHVLEQLLYYAAKIEDRLFMHVPESRRDWPSCQTIRAVYGKGARTIPKQFDVGVTDDFLFVRGIGDPSDRLLDRRRWCWFNIIETVRRAAGVPAPKVGYHLNSQNCSIGTIEIRMLGDRLELQDVLGWIEFASKFIAAPLLMNEVSAHSFCTRDPFEIDELRSLRRFAKSGRCRPSHRVFSSDPFMPCAQVDDDVELGAPRRIIEQDDFPIICDFTPDPLDPPRRIVPSRDNDGNWTLPYVSGSHY